jgi:hypothetical protein
MHHFWLQQIRTRWLCKEGSLETTFEEGACDEVMKYWDDAARGQRRDLRRATWCSMLTLFLGISYCEEGRDRAMDERERRRREKAGKELGVSWKSRDCTARRLAPFESYLRPLFVLRTTFLRLQNLHSFTPHFMHPCQSN